MSTSAPHPFRAAALAAVALAAVALAAPGRATAGYGWPVKPFHVQHPIRGYLGDPRIGKDGATISRSLHFGVDVSARNGTPVYAVVSGRVYRHPLHPDVLLVQAGDTTYEYWHIVPAMSGGYARAFATVIGHVERPWAHVHFSERRGGIYLNPLRPGGLTPYRDTTRPTIRAIRRAGSSLVLDAYDTTPLPVPPPWAGRPVSPALVEWRTTGEWHVVDDFRTTLPTTTFAGVYASATEQNLASRSGRYLFELRGAPSDVAVVVRVEDTAGNAATAAYAPRDRALTATHAQRRLRARP